MEKKIEKTVAVDLTYKELYQLRLLLLMSDNFLSCNSIRNETSLLISLLRVKLDNATCELESLDVNDIPF